MKQERKIEDYICNFDCLKSNMWSAISQLFGLVTEDEDEILLRKKEQMCTSQPTIWNKLGKDLKISYPIYTTQDWQDKYAGRIKQIETMLRTRIIKYDKCMESFSKAKGINERMRSCRLLEKLITSQSEWRPSSTISQIRYKPVFVYIGSFENDTTYAVVLDKDSNLEASYYGVSTKPNDVNNLWKKVMDGFDWQGSIKSVVLMDKFYSLSKQTGCPTLHEGDVLKNIWDNDLDQMYSAEINYEQLGFGEGIIESSYNRQYSKPGFSCINIFDGHTCPNIFYGSNDKLVWHITNKSLMLVGPKTGYIYEKYNILGKTPEHIAEKIAEHCD